MLVIDRLSKTYPNGVHALADFSLRIEPGEIVAIVGGSGCGKTTLLRLAAGLESPSNGLVSIDDERIRAPHPAIGLVFQEPRLLPWLTVGGNITFGLDGLGAAEKQRRLREALSRVGLAGYENRWPRELSGGQAQRVSILRALIAGPKVLLLDEPFSALDALTRANLHGHLLDLWHAYRPTLVMVTHDVDEAILLADRVVVMQPHPGRLFAEVPIELDRPRDPLSTDFTAAKRQILAGLGRAMH
jgi:sulfonate transport system ATP-binding protein